MSKNINRDTNVNDQTDGIDENGNVYNFKKDMPTLLNNIDVSAYLDKNGLFNFDAYMLLSGEFSFTNLQDKMGELTMKMNNPFTEYVVGMFLFQPNRIKKMFNIKHPAVSKFANITTYESLPFYSAIKEHYVNTMKYINLNEKRKRYKKGPRGGKGKLLLSIESPITSRQIKVDKAAYKKIYKQIKIKQITYKKLSMHTQTDYDIVTNCAVDFLKTLDISIIDIENILNRKVLNDLNYKDISNVLQCNNIGCKFLTVFDDELINNGLPIKYIFKLHNEHLYVINDEIIKYTRPIVIKNIDEIMNITPAIKNIDDVVNINDIDRNDCPTIIKNINDIKTINKIIKSIDGVEKYKNRLLIVESPELFKDIRTHIKKDYSMIGYNDKEMLFKSNKIRLNPMYTEDKLMLNTNESKCKTAYNYINSRLNFLGYMSNADDILFRNCNKVRLFKTDKMNDVQYDMNKAYKSILLNNKIVYPIPTIDDNWQVYSNMLCAHGFYYCELKSYDKILGRHNDIYFYDEVVELIKHDRIKRIKCEFVTVNKIRLCDEQIKFISDLSNDLSRRFIGWLQKSLSIVTKKYDDVTEDEGLAMCNFYGPECTYYKNKNMSTIHKSYTRKQTGLLVNILIKGLTNVELFKFNNDFMKLNPNAILNSIKTDSLGYLCNNAIAPMSYISDKIGGFKNEKSSSKCLKNYEYECVPIAPTIPTLKLNTLCEKSLNEYLDNNYSLLIDGIFGCGKTSVIIPQIEKILNESNKKYIKATPTKTSSELINGHTLFSLFSKKSDYELMSYFGNYDYLIIDERTLIDQKTYKYLEFIKENTKIKFILIGDDKQIKNRFVNYSHKDSIFIMSLVDSNVIELTNENKRGDEILAKHLKHLARDDMDIGEASEYILSNFNVVNESKTDMNLTLYKTTKDNMIKNTGKRCDVIINSQGSTIDEPFTLHEFDKIHSVNILMTALSRSTKSEYINICINKKIK